MSAVDVLELGRVYPSSDGKPVRAVDGLTFQVEAGTVFGLLGANGAGKSTTMRILATLTTPTSGTARVCGHDVVEAPGRVRESLGYLSASSGLPSRATCREVLQLFAALHGVDDIDGATDVAIERFGIGAFADRRVEALSTGMRQRVRIATAAIHDPAVLVLDEPTAGLDLVAADQLLGSILEARGRGAAILFSTHILREVEQICDRMAVIHEGRLRAEGTAEELMAHTETERLDEAFLALVRT